MRTEFRKVNPHQEIRRLLAFDRKVFQPADRFHADYWYQLESYWMLIGGVRVGCCGFEKHVDFVDDLPPGMSTPDRPGSLFIATTGIRPQDQGIGLGQLMKAWQICYARRHGFQRIVTNVRSRNTAMLNLNRKFHFQVLRTIPDFYTDPADATVVLELVLSDSAR